MVWFKNKKEQMRELRIKSLVPQVKRIIEESLQIINSTKNIKTGIGRFETIKTMLQRLLNEIPSGEVEKYLPVFSLNNQKVTSYDDLKLIDDAKNKWIKEMVFENIERERKKADVLTDKKLKNQQLKKALKEALNGIEFIPDDVYLKTKITEIESEIN